MSESNTPEQHDRVDYAGIRALTGMASSTVKVAIGRDGFPKGFRMGRRKQWSKALVIEWHNRKLAKGK